MVEAVQEAQIREHGGSYGIRDSGLLESALGRPQQKFAHVEDADEAVFAAASLFGVAKNHPFVDGNKRASFMTAYAFLGMNGFDLDASEPEIVTIVENVAAGKMSEAKLVEWFRAALTPLE